MSVYVKICGIKDEATLQTAVDGGANFVGFNFYPPSPRAITVEIARRLVRVDPYSVKRVGLFVDPSDLEINAVCELGILDIIQLHGKEGPGRIEKVREVTGLPVMKAIRIAVADDLKQIGDYDKVADMLLFDSKTDSKLPGGSGKSFDWELLKNITPACPWMLAGGINASNIRQAVAATGASIVDVSSGVEDSPGVKNPDKIRELLAIAASI